MKTTTRIGTLLAGSAFVISAVAFADTPKLEGPHGHAASVSGKVTMFRVQERGLEILSGGKTVEAEVMVQLDGKPNMVFALPFHEDDPARREIVETLRQAYLRNTPVTLEHKLAPGQKVAKINWVQFGALDVSK